MPSHRQRRSSGHRPWSVWWLPVATLVVGHALLVPGYFAARRWDLARRPLGFGHWPGEPGWPAGSGSSEFGPGVAPLAVGVLLVWLAVVLAALTAGLIALLRMRRERAFGRRPHSAA